MHNKSISIRFRALSVFLTLFMSINKITSGAAAQHSVVYSPIISYFDLTYAPTSEKNRLDLYLPNSIGPFPTVIWIHGGGWYTGSRALPRDYPVLEHTIAAGFALASIDYRLSSDALFPGQIQDVIAAIRWLRTNAHTYDLDPERIIAWGDSSGAHLAALAGTAWRDSAFEDLQHQHLSISSRLAGVIAWEPPTDLLQLDAQALPGSTYRHNDPDSFTSRLFGCPIQTCKEQVSAANPIVYVSPDDPPFLIQHGANDNLISPEQSIVLANALHAHGVEATLYLLPHTDHGSEAFLQADQLSAVDTFLNARRVAPPLPPLVFLPLVSNSLGL